MRPFKTVRQDWVRIPRAKAHNIKWTPSPSRYSIYVANSNREQNKVADSSKKIKVIRPMFVVGNSISLQLFFSFDAML